MIRVVKGKGGKDRGQRHNRSRIRNQELKALGIGKRRCVHDLSPTICPEYVCPQQPRAARPGASGAGRHNLPAMGENTLSAEAVEPNVRMLLELLFERLDMAVGPWRLEVAAEDGAIRRLYRHEGPISRAGLGQFDRRASNDSGDD